MSVRIAYFVSQYPALSHSFIRREVAALRASGLAVETFTLRRAEDEDVLTPEDREERQRTWAILPSTAGRLLGDQLRALGARPGAYAGTLSLALRHRNPGLRGLVWAFIRFAEALRLARELTRRGVTHLHVHFANAGGDVGLLASRYLGIGWSLTLHGTADFDPPAGALLGAKIAAADFVACVSHFGRAQAMRTCDPALWPRLEVVRCGIDLRRFDFHPPRADGGTVRVVSVGRLSPEKGQRGLLEAFAGLARRGLDAELRLVGEGPERPALEAAIERLGLRDRCRLLGARPEAEVKAELAAAHVFVLTSLMEGLPVVLMEAMALGVPVIAPRLSGIPELVEDNETGVLFTPARWDELEEKLAALLRDPDRRMRLAHLARAKVEREFAIERAVEPLARRLGAPRGPRP